METGIKDTSNNGVYHNGKFKAQAEEYLKKESLAEHFLPVR